MGGFFLAFTSEIGFVFGSSSQEDSMNVQKMTKK
jgi:hypothetical protein